MRHNKRGSASHRQWQKAATLLRRVASCTQDYCFNLEATFENSTTDGAKYVAQTIFVLLHVHLSDLHRAEFGKLPRVKNIEWLSTVSDEDIEAVVDLLWSLSAELYNIARAIQNNIDADRVHAIPSDIEKGYNTLKSGLERLYVLLTDKAPAKLYE